MSPLAEGGEQHVVPRAWLQDKEALLGSNVFARRYMGPGAGVVFESRSAEVYAQEHLGLTQH